ncbi:MAG: BMP family protein [Syntrophobacteraceae bacterium]
MMRVRKAVEGLKRRCRAPMLFVAVCCLVGAWPVSNSVAGKPLKVVVLTDAAGLGDKGFNDVCWQGVERAKEAFGLDAQFLQSREQADYVANLTLTARHADVTVTLGYLFEDAVREVAPLVSDKPFIHIEGDITSDNVASFDFRSEEGGFLAGLVAGLFTKAYKIGVVAGMDIPPVEAYVTGFKAGVKTAQQYREKPLEIVVAYAGSFNDPVKGKALAQAAIDQGVDVIFRAAGNTGIGVLEAVKGANGVYLIAEDLDQDAELPGRILTSALKRMDVAVYQALEAVVQGRFQGGHRWLGAAEGAVDITDMVHTRSLFSEADLDRIQQARQLLKDKKLMVPKRYGELPEFQPPALTNS